MDLLESQNDWFKSNQRDGLCYCGCGEITPVSSGTHRRYGYLKGQHRLFVPTHHLRGRVQSEETRAKRSASLTGIVRSRETCDRMSAGQKANRAAIEATCARNALRTGERNPNWRGGTATERNMWRVSAEGRTWRIAVFERDDYTCQECGARGGTLNAHHIKPWATHPELRSDISNGQTLCEPCHRLTPTWGHPKAVAA